MTSILSESTQGHSLFSIFLFYDVARNNFFFTQFCIFRKFVSSSIIFFIPKFATKIIK